VTVSDLRDENLQGLTNVDDLTVGFVGLLQQVVDRLHGFGAIVVGFDWIDGACWTTVDAVLELGVLAEATRVAEEGILLVVVDRTTCGGKSERLVSELK
jgi:hypothetical protein